MELGPEVHNKQITGKWMLHPVVLEEAISTESV